MLRIELLVDARNDLGEGPLSDVQEQRLYWIDSHGCAVHRGDARGEELRTWQVPEHIGSMCLMPVDSITSVIFGGAELDILYVTSMTRLFRGRRRQEREAGGLFAVHGLGVQGLPEPRFKG